MGFMGNIFKVLGFEGESKHKASKKVQTKATYSLKKANSRPEQIDGVSVYYPEKKEQVKDFVVFSKSGKAIIISTECLPGDEGERTLDFLNGFVLGANARLVTLTENKLYLILPEGMEVEE